MNESAVKFVSAAVAVVKTKRFWSLLAVAAVAFGAGATVPVLAVIETVTCALLGGCVS